MSKKKVRYGVVGLGHIAQMAVLPAFEHASKNSELTALISDDPEKLRLIARKYAVDALFSYDEYDLCLRSGAIDAVYIALPNHLHRDYAVRAARAGIHVLCEKPMAVTQAECRSMMAAADKNDIRLMIAYRLHFEESNLGNIELIRAGKIGEPRLFSSVFTMNVREGDIRLQKRELGGGTLYDIGIYCINAARYLFGSEPVEVRAVSATSDDPRFAHSEEMVSAVLRFPGDRLATFTCSFGATKSGSYEVVGTKGSLRLEPAYEYAAEITRTVTIGGKLKKKTFAKRDQFAAELLYFSDCVLRGKEPEPSGKEGLIDVKIIEALYRSVRSRRPVRLDPPDKASRPRMKQEIQRPPVKKPKLVRTTPPTK